MEPSLPSRPHVLIIGAGLGGLLLAQILRKNKISYEVFERDRNAYDRLQGWSIAIHSMLDELRASVPDDLPPFEQTSNLLPLTLTPEFVFYPKSGGRKGVLDEGSGKIVRANRSRLREWLSTNIPIQYNKQAARIDEGDTSVTVHFKDGSSAVGDIVVGADGSRSAVRKSIVGEQNDPLRWEPVVMITTDVELDEKDMWEHLHLGTSLWGIDYKDPNGERTWFMSFTDKIAPDAKSGKFYFSLIWKDPAAAEKDFWIYSATKEQLYKCMRQRAATIPTRFSNVIKKAKPEGVKTPPLRLSTLVLKSMPVGRVTLLGDAAHSMTPFRGEGGSQAMMDAVRLGEALVKCDKFDTDSIKGLLGPYQDEMLQRGGEAAKFSQLQYALERNPGAAKDRMIAGHLIEPLPEKPISVTT
ncbi:putative monooxygenase [Xylariaceae sp. FL1651]|nr:putative monooxygenase [Xylariaceae sp. FL1651]